MLLRYGALCEACDYRTDYYSTYEDRFHNVPTCPKCDDDMEKAWIGDGPYSTPERMWAEGRNGQKLLINDCDDPWEGDGTSLCAEQSEEFMAKRKETLNGKVANWGERSGPIHFDTGGK